MSALSSRGIYDSIAKTLSYLLAGNAGELVVMLVAGLVGWPLPLLPCSSSGSTS